MKLPESSAFRANLGETLQGFGRKFLGEDSILQGFEELEAGVSYNYKVQFGGKSYILKVDNPTIGMRAHLKERSNDTRSGDERFNTIAQFVNDKVAKGLQAPSFLGVQGEDGNFCVTAGTTDEALPPEFRGNTVSMQPFLEITKPASKSLSSKEVASLATNLGILHRPSHLAAQFPTPEAPPLADSFRQNREKLLTHFGATEEERTSKIAETAQNIDGLITRLSTKTDPESIEMHKNMMRWFPEGKCDVALLSAIVERACKEKSRDDLSTRQISHNDLHQGNMLRDGANVTIIDFDELGRSGITDDVWMQLDANLDVFRREEEVQRKEAQKRIVAGNATEQVATAEVVFSGAKRTPITPLPTRGSSASVKQDEIENFLAAYMGNNPYMTRREFQKVVDSSVEVPARIASDSMLKVAKFAGNQNPSVDEVKEFSGFISREPGILAMFEQATTHEETRKEALGMAYDEAFAKEIRGRSEDYRKKHVTVDALTDLDALTDPSLSTKKRDPLEHLNLDLGRAKGTREASWVEKIEADRAKSKSDNDRQTP